VAHTVLVCDNEEALRELVRDSLEDEDYDLVEARDGDEALVVARRTRPDLIVLDMMMPGRSGLEVLLELRRDPVLARTPVIMLTARTQSVDRDASAAAGANRFVAKPFSPLELVAVVEEVLAERP
jgi:two-component system, OmpR family, phosphate regulon response regulator PhoB